LKKSRARIEWVKSQRPQYFGGADFGSKRRAVSLNTKREREGEHIASENGQGKVDGRARVTREFAPDQWREVVMFWWRAPTVCVGSCQKMHNKKAGGLELGFAGALPKCAVNQVECLEKSFFHYPIRRRL